MRLPKRVDTIRARLTLAYAASSTVLLVTYAALVYGFLAQRLEDDLDRDLRGDFEVAESMLGLDPDGSLRFAGAEHYDFDEIDQLHAEVWDPDGELLVRTRSVSAGAGGVPVASGRRTVRIHGERVRVLEGPHAVSGRPVLIRVFRSEERMHDTLGTLALFAVFGLPLGVGIAAVGGYLLAGRALAPVSRITEHARRITADQLDERLPVHNPHDEIGELALVFNDTFERLHASFDRMRRFTADASHELRTPLTSLRSVGEVALAQSRTGDEYEDAIGSMLEEVDRLTALLDGLLTLSRADASRFTLDRRPRDVLELVEQVASDLSVLAEVKGQTVSVSGDRGSAPIDPTVFQLCLVNVLDNAIKHTPEGTAIAVTVSASPEMLTIDVADRGPGIPVQHRDRVFDRFHRVDVARSREAGGTGLGLSIARWAVEAHGGALVLLDGAEGEGSTFRIRVPREPGEG